MSFYELPKSMALMMDDPRTTVGDLLLEAGNWRTIEEATTNLRMLERAYDYFSNQKNKYTMKRLFHSKE